MEHSLTVPVGEPESGSRAPDEEISVPLGKWVYENVCIFGLEILRRVYRVKRFFKRLLRPVVRASVSFFSLQRRRAVYFIRNIRSVFRNIRTGSRDVLSALRSGGISAAAATVGKSMAKAGRRHGRFAVSALNYLLPLVCVTLLLVTIINVFGRTYALAVECNGKTVGYISDEKTYVEATEMVSQRVITSGEDFRSALQPSYSLVSVDQTELSDAAGICENILLGSRDVSEATGFFVDGRLLGAVKSNADMRFLLERFLEKYRIGAEQETISFASSTETVKGLYSSEVILSSEEFDREINTTHLKTRIYTVTADDTYEGILGRFAMTAERFAQLNEGFPGEVHEGDTVVIEKELPVLTVQSVVVSSYEATIAYTTVTENDPTKFTTYREKKQEGVNGVQKITQQITYIDGIESSRVVLSRETIAEPVNEIYVVGTMPTTTIPNAGHISGYVSAAGDKGVIDESNFGWPLPGVTTLSSRYGYRWGRLHAGVDISTGGVYGRTIVAAKAGTVILVKNSPSGYGLYLDISHGNGYTTRYAHCSEILVSAGQVVSKGQAIAKVGNSGSSTGPHLHFEIRYNGNPTNPMDYY